MNILLCLAGRINAKLIVILIAAGVLFVQSARPVHAEFGSSRIFSEENNRVLAETALKIGFGYVREAWLTEEIQFGRPAKSLLIKFRQPQQVLSTLHGWQSGVLTVGNHYSPPESWQTAHTLGLEQMNLNCMRLLQLDPAVSSFLYTGADVGRYAYVETNATENGCEIRLGVLATAGVETNAVRVGHDPGGFWEPGTINLIILSSRHLSAAAMCQMIIVATEAKTAALQDLDVRSSYSGKAATGTGTDNIIVVAGEGAPATMAGPHTKLGELTGRAVYQAVIDAVEKQNNLTADRDILERLAERRVDVRQLVLNSPKIRDAAAKQCLADALLLLLSDPYYMEFTAMALAHSDAVSRGLVPVGAAALADWNLLVASKLAGERISRIEPVLEDARVDPTLLASLNALVYGLLRRGDLNI